MAYPNDRVEMSSYYHSHSPREQDPAGTPPPFTIRHSEGPAPAYHDGPLSSSSSSTFSLPSGSPPLPRDGVPGTHMAPNAAAAAAAAIAYPLAAEYNDAEKPLDLSIKPRDDDGEKRQKQVYKPRHHASRGSHQRWSPYPMSNPNGSVSCSPLARMDYYPQRQTTSPAYYSSSVSGGGLPSQFELRTTPTPESSPIQMLTSSNSVLNDLSGSGGIFRPYEDENASDASSGPDQSCEQSRPAERVQEEEGLTYMDLDTATPNKLLSNKNVSQSSVCIRDKKGGRTKMSCNPSSKSGQCGFTAPSSYYSHSHDEARLRGDVSSHSQSQTQNDDHVIKTQQLSQPSGVASDLPATCSSRPPRVKTSPSPRLRGQGASIKSKSPQGVSYQRHSKQLDPDSSTDSPLTTQLLKSPKMSKGKAAKQPSPDEDSNFNDLSTQVPVGKAFYVCPENFTQSCLQRLLRDTFEQCVQATPSQFEPNKGKVKIPMQVLISHQVKMSLMNKPMFPNQMSHHQPMFPNQMSSESRVTA